MDVGTGAWLGLIGLAAGLSGGLLGIGGSIVMIPAMTELMCPDPHKFQAAALIAKCRNTVVASKMFGWSGTSASSRLASTGCFTTS